MTHTKITISNSILCCFVGDLHYYLFQSTNINIFIDSVVGAQEEWRQVGRQYYSKLGGRDYFKDLAAIHDVLGLTAKYGTASAFASLVG